MRDGELPINEIFQTVQGEAHWTGTPAVFIRLQGCDVGCPWCDTKHTWPINPSEEVSLEAMMEKSADSQAYAGATTYEILGILDTMKARHVVITGGEPCAFDLTELTQHIVDSGRTVQIETSGTEEVRANFFAWVTVSPKLGMPGRKTVLDQALWLADEIKMPVGKQLDIDKLQILLSGLPHRPLVPRRPPLQIWLQPLSQSPKATQLCVEAATEHGWRISVQTHKYLGVR